MKLVFATQNPSKVKEMRAMFAGLPFEVVSATEAGVREEVVEDGKTLEENALKKARFVCERTSEWAVADDSGICIQALGGKPGVHSARWAGEGADERTIIDHTLAAMAEIPEGRRNAYFESTVALCAPDGRFWTFVGRVDGSIALADRGVSRPKFPYDNLFVPQGHTRTFAEMSGEEKNSMSHRGRAFEQLREFLSKNH